MEFTKLVKEKLIILTDLSDKAVCAKKAFLEEQKEALKKGLNFPHVCNESRLAYLNMQKELFNKIDTALELLVKGNTSQLDLIFAFLMLKKGIDRGGYRKEHVCRMLKKHFFNSEQKAILQTILLEQIVCGGREFRDYVKLTPKIYTSELKKRIEEFDDRNIEYIKKRKELLLSRIACMHSENWC